MTERCNATARVLVVEDSEMAAWLLEEVLKGAGYEVQVVHSAESAILHMEGKQPDLVLTDLMMPGIDGFELCRRIRQRPEWRGLPVVAITQATELEAKLRGFQAGIDDFVSKEAATEELLARVQVLLRRSAGQTPSLLDAMASRRRGKIVVFFSLKGGAGISTLIANLALLLAEQCDTGVAVLDLALEQGIQDLLLDLKPRTDLGQLAANEVSPAALTPYEIERLVTMHDGNVALLAAPADPAMAERVSPELTTAALEALAGAYELVLVDTPSSFTEHALRAIEIADLVVVVGTPDVAGARAMGAALRICRQVRGSDESLLSFLNGVSMGAVLTSDQVAKAMKLQIDASIPFDSAFQNALNTGRPLVLQVERRRRSGMLGLGTMEKRGSPSAQALGEVVKLMESRLGTLARC